MTKQEHIRKIFDALHMRDQIWNEEKKEYESVPTIKGEKREQLSEMLADLLTENNEDYQDENQG